MNEKPLTCTQSVNLLDQVFSLHLCLLSQTHVCYSMRTCKRWAGLSFDKPGFQLPPAAVPPCCSPSLPPNLRRSVPESDKL